MACGGDPGAAPRLFIVNRTSDQMAKVATDPADGGMRMLPMRVARALAAAAAITGSATAARADCLAASDLEQVVPYAATVSLQQPRTYFVRGGEVPGCPADTPACRAHAYAVPRDTVVVTGTQGAFSCALLPTAKGNTTEGWLPSAALAPAVPTQPAPDAWVGHWRTGDQSLTISASSSGLLHVKGEATFGSHDPDRVRRGAVNLGEVEGTVEPQGNLLAFTQGDNGRTLPFSDADPYACRIRMRLAGPFLWAWENGCGGMGVSFIGAYARTSG